MRLLAGLILMAAIVASPAAAAFKTDLRDITIGMTPDQVRATVAGCKHEDPSNVWRSVKDASGAWIGQSMMTCRVAGEPDSALRLTITSSLSGKTVCRVDYEFYSARTNDALVADAREQFGVGETRRQDAGVYLWKLSSQLDLVLTVYMQQKTLSLRSHDLCARDAQAVADYAKARQNTTPAPSF